MTVTKTCKYCGKENTMKLDKRQRPFFACNYHTKDKVRGCGHNELAPLDPVARKAWENENAVTVQNNTQQNAKQIVNAENGDVDITINNNECNHEEEKGWGEW